MTSGEGFVTLRGVCHDTNPFITTPSFCCLCYALQLYFQSKYSCALNSVIPLWTPTAKSRLVLTLRQKSRRIPTLTWDLGFHQ